MKHILTRLMVAATLLTAVGVLNAQQQQFPSHHYPAGAEGIKGASLPPPGIYLRDYNFFYWSDKIPTGGPPGFDAFLYANAPRIIWITDLKLLGAYYGMDIIIPFYYGRIEAGGGSSDTFTLGDIQLEPITLSWHLQQMDLAVGYAIWMPSGASGGMANLLGAGFWSHMLTAGGTYFFDKDKTWALSLLGRYEFNTENENNNQTPGQMLTLEWGASKSLSKTVDVGVVGYWQQQTTKDSGAGAGNALSQVFGVGPEISMFCPKMGLFTSLRYNREFAARYRPEGNTVTLTFTKRF